MSDDHKPEVTKVSRNISSTLYVAYLRDGFALKLTVIVLEVFVSSMVESKSLEIMAQEVIVVVRSQSRMLRQKMRRRVNCDRTKSGKTLEAALRLGSCK